ncbi:MAG: FHA domain-containing protein [Chloroflexota bacterium]
MNLTDAILKSYVVLRRKGHPPLEALEKLRPRVEGLAAHDKGRIVAGVRYYEQQVKKRRTAMAGRGVAVAGGSSHTPVGTPSICESCSTLNWNDQTTCRACNAPLKTSNHNDHMMTRRLGAGDGQRSEEFRPGNTLILRMPEQMAVVELSPQAYDRSLIFGRFDHSGGIIPDVDLGQYGGTEQGVSRLHMALTYDARRNYLTVKDMGSSNGVFINGQRLPVFDTSVLRNGDRLELGNLLMQVVYANS